MSVWFLSQNGRWPLFPLSSSPRRGLALLPPRPPPARAPRPARARPTQPGMRPHGKGHACPAGLRKLLRQSVPPSDAGAAERVAGEATRARERACCSGCRGQAAGHLRSSIV